MTFTSREDQEFAERWPVLAAWLEQHAQESPAEPSAGVRGLMPPGPAAPYLLSALALLVLAPVVALAVVIVVNGGVQPRLAVRLVGVPLTLLTYVLTRRLTPTVGAIVITAVAMVAV